MSARGRPRYVADLPQIDPIVPVLQRAPFGEPGWVYEPKYDGYRGVLSFTPASCVIHSKRRISFTRFRGLCATVRSAVAADEAILDGEIVALDRTGWPLFGELQRADAARLAYAAFDRLWLDGRDHRGLPLRERNALLSRVLPATKGGGLSRANPERRWGGTLRGSTDDGFRRHRREAGD
jgi:bifunctional non-homologous end joining protein LigD